jgi:hypothetical protein
MPEKAGDRDANRPHTTARPGIMACMSAAMYLARISAVPYAGQVLPHLTGYLEHLLESAIARHTLVHSIEHVVETGPEYDTTTIRVWFRAANDAEASAITREAGDRIRTSDEHWRLVGVAVEQTGTKSLTIRTPRISSHASRKVTR